MHYGWEFHHPHGEGKWDKDVGRQSFFFSFFFQNICCAISKMSTEAADEDVSRGVSERRRPSHSRVLRDLRAQARGGTLFHLLQSVLRGAGLVRSRGNSATRRRHEIKNRRRVSRRFLKMTAAVVTAAAAVTMRDPPHDGRASGRATNVRPYILHSKKKNGRRCCRFCSKSFDANSKTTTTCRDHMINCHPQVNKKIEAEREQGKTYDEAVESALKQVREDGKTAGALVLSQRSMRDFVRRHFESCCGPVSVSPDTWKGLRRRISFVLGTIVGGEWRLELFALMQGIRSNTFLYRDWN